MSPSPSPRNLGTQWRPLLGGLLLLALASVFSTTRSQEPIASGPYQLLSVNSPQPYHYALNPGRSSRLLNDTPLAAGLGSGAYLSGVGGIAFDGVARAAPGTVTPRLRLRYDPGQPDGRRLQVIIDGRPYDAPNLPDWQLLPIARYADSPHFAAITLFGKLEGDLPRPKEAKYVVGYHPALKDTLLGLRLFQSDFLVLDPHVAGELPRRKGNLLLGAGEQPPEPKTWWPAARRLSEAFQGGEGFQSYVICDSEVPIGFQFSETDLLISGDPYWFFWRRGAPREELITENGKQVIITNSFEVVPLRDLGRRVSADVTHLEHVNPAVYGSLVKTMRYAAFFRYCKANHAAAWRNFLQSIEAVNPTPAAATPVLVMRVDGKR
ncbi:MAG TPA: hypothetical protein VEL76_19455 [Gemmataceae bacterium]|nr:hypothetical protein [Gemmataceae bacterium]